MTPTELAPSPLTTHSTVSTTPIFFRRLLTNINHTHYAGVNFEVVNLNGNRISSMLPTGLQYFQL